MNKRIKIVYIDDMIDIDISKYMNDSYCKIPFFEKTIIKEFKEVVFNTDEGYESILNNNEVREANIILVDNRLFENNMKTGKFSGKQFKVLLRKLYPYVEVLIITQDKGMLGHKIIHKFSGHYDESSDEYYNNMLLPALDNAISEVLDFDNLAEDLKNSADVEQALIEKVLLSIQGENSYDELKVSDIDKLIDSFKDLKEGLQK